MRSLSHKQGGCDYTEIKLWLLEQPSVRYRRDFGGIRWPHGEGFRLITLDVLGWRSMRGGSWYGTQDSARVGYRNDYAPVGRNYFIGFRLTACPESNINIR